MPDIRWGRCDIKTVMLLPASLAKEAARKEGAREAWFVDAEGYVTEGGSSNAWIVDRDGRLITRQVDDAILRGITRTTLIDLLQRENIQLVERPFTVEEAKAAREAFITSATNIVMPVVRIDGKPIGNGAPGLLSLRLRSEFHSAAEIAAR
jgi:D-alanine transaminase